MNRIKRGVTYIEVLSSLFIITIIFTFIFPFIVKGKDKNIDRAASKVIGELKYAKSLAISKDSNIDIVFSGFKNGGYTYMEYFSKGKSQGVYSVPSGFLLLTNNADLSNKNLVFRPDGTLNHRATTVKVKDISNNKEASITLTIGYTRIMRVN